MVTLEEVRALIRQEVDLKPLIEKIGTICDLFPGLCQRMDGLEAMAKSGHKSVGEFLVCENCEPGSKREIKAHYPYWCPGCGELFKEKPSEDRCPGCQDFVLKRR